MEEEHPGSKFHFSPSKWFEQWPPSLTGKRMRSRTCEVGTPNVWEFPVVSEESGESPGQPVRLGTESWAWAHSRHWVLPHCQKGVKSEGPRTLKGSYKASRCKRSGLGEAWGRRGVQGADWPWSQVMGTRFHYTILSTFVHGQNSLSKIKNKKSLQELKPRKEKSLKRKNPVK